MDLFSIQLIIVAVVIYSLLVAVKRLVNQKSSPTETLNSPDKTILSTLQEEPQVAAIETMEESGRSRNNILV